MFVPMLCIMAVKAGFIKLGSGSELLEVLLLALELLRGLGVKGAGRSKRHCFSLPISEEPLGELWKKVNKKSKLIVKVLGSEPRASLP